MSAKAPTGRSCDWDFVTSANPTGRPCGRAAKWEVNYPEGYHVCGIHKRSAEAIGDIDIRPHVGSSAQ